MFFLPIVRVPELLWWDVSEVSEDRDGIKHDDEHEEEEQGQK